MTIERDELLAHFGELWPAHNRAITELLVACRRHFDGDLDYALILGAVGDRTLAGTRNRGISYDEFVAGKRGSTDPRVINTHSVAHTTGIPWETARRKIARLIARGWLERREDGGLTVSKQAAIDMAPLTQLTFDYLLLMAEEFGKIATRTANR